MNAALLLLLALPAAAADLGGHERVKPAIGDVIAEPAPADERRATLEEMWQRRVLAPDQNAWSPQDYELLQKIRRSENDALELLKKKFGGYRQWTAQVRTGRRTMRHLTKDGYEKYLFVLTQDAIGYFQSKGADAKWVFQLRDWDGKPMFDGKGLITDEGAAVYRRARLNLEAFWKGPNGETYGTRRPPTKNP